MGLVQSRKSPIEKRSERAKQRQEMQEWHGVRGGSEEDGAHRYWSCQTGETGLDNPWRPCAKFLSRRPNRFCPIRWTARFIFRHFPKRFVQGFAQNCSIVGILSDLERDPQAWEDAFSFMDLEDMFWISTTFFYIFLTWFTKNRKERWISSLAKRSTRIRCLGLLSNGALLKRPKHSLFTFLFFNSIVGWRPSLRPLVLGSFC